LKIYLVKYEFYIGIELKYYIIVKDSNIKVYSLNSEHLFTLDNDYIDFFNIEKEFNSFEEAEELVKTIGIFL